MCPLIAGRKAGGMVFILQRKMAARVYEAITCSDGSRRLTNSDIGQFPVRGLDDEFDVVVCFGRVGTSLHVPGIHGRCCQS
jgi:hypothetical protein